MRSPNDNLEPSRRPSVEVIRRRRTYCCVHCGYQGHRGTCPRCGNLCDPFPSKSQRS